MSPVIDLKISNVPVVTASGISEPQLSIPVRALVDTGADLTAIDIGLLESIGARVAEKDAGEVVTMHGSEKYDLYLINVHSVETNKNFGMIVSGLKIRSEKKAYEMVIGLNLLTKGRLEIVGNSGGTFTLTL